VIEEPTAGVAPAAETDADSGDATGAKGAAEPTGSASAAEDAPAEEEAEKSVWDDPRLPWSGKPGKADIACWAAVVGSGLFLLALLPFRAALVGTHPVLGELLNGSTESVISAAAFARTGHGSLIVAILAAFPGMMKFDLVWWWAGRLWGEKLILLISGRRSHGSKAMARVHKWGPRFTWPAVIVTPFLPIPNTIVYAVAGWAGMRLVTFIVLDFIGTALWTGLLIGLGWGLGHHAVVVAQAISRYSLWVSLGIVVIVVVGQFRPARRKGLIPPETLP
jgi:membrane protein DedA with SNARE-associated domain